MRTLRSLFPDLVDPEFLDDSATLAARGKRRRHDVARFLFEREREIHWLVEALRSGSWRPAGFALVFVRDPKPRAIARAPFADRVVHRAVVQLVERAFARSYTPASFACRPGLGAQRAALALQRALRRQRFFLHLDVRSYFPSLDPDRVLALLARRIRDERFLEVVRRILDSGRGLYDSERVRRFARIDPDWPPRGRGLPIGASTSQCFASQIVLLELDQRIRRELRVPAYVRYVDDLFLAADSPAALERVRDDVAAWLARERDLRLKRPDARPRSTRGALHALGFRIERGQIEPLARARRELRAFVARELWRPVWGGRGVDVTASLASRVGRILGP